MDPATAILSFSLAALLVTLTPGLDTALVLRTAMVEGPRRGMIAGAGITLGVLIWGIAAAAGIHPGHLHRLFGEQTGKSINALLRSLRIDRAKQMLLSGSLPAEAIALAAGFSSRPYFHRVFKAQTGLSPGEFRSAFNITCD